MSPRQDPVSMTLNQAQDVDVDQELQDAINRTFDHLVDGKYHGPEDEDDPLNDEDMTTASRAALAAGIPRRDINEVEISKIVEEMLRKFLQEHALPILGTGGSGSLPRLAFSPTSPYETPLLPGGPIPAHFLNALTRARSSARPPDFSIDSGADRLTHAIGPIMKFSLIP
eukprot:COSAG01_NODE_9517_length_2421_cov_47.931094_1_plen_170_part_00